MQTESQRKAKATYQRKLKAITIAFYPSDETLYQYLQTQKNKVGYIKNLIKQDMQKDGK